MHAFPLVHRQSANHGTAPSGMSRSRSCQGSRDALRGTIRLTAGAARAREEPLPPEERETVGAGLLGRDPARGWMQPPEGARERAAIATAVAQREQVGRLLRHREDLV